MGTLDEQEQGKNKVTEVKIYTVPFSLGAIKESITIDINNSPPKLSKEQIINQAFHLHSQGRILEASKYYQNFIDQDFTDPFVFSNYGLILNNLGKPEEAEKLYRKAIKLKPDFAEAFFNLGNTLSKLIRLEEAEKTYCKAIELKPDFAEAYFNLGNTLKELSKLEEAKKSYFKAIELKPDYANAYFNLGNTLKELSQLEEAKESYFKAIELKPDYANAYLNLGIIFRGLENLKEAEISTRKAIELSPDLADAYSSLGTILSGFDKLQEAEISIRKAIKLKPNFSEAFSNLATILRDRGKLQEAEISIRKSIKINPNFAEAYFNLGTILRDRGELQEAEISIRKAIKIKPNFADAFSNLGRILNELDKSQSALDACLKAIEINPKNTNIYSYIARLLKDSDLSVLDESKLKSTLRILLEREDIDHQELFKAFNFLYIDKIKSNLRGFGSDFISSGFINEKLIINTLKKIVFSDPKWEEILTRSRGEICRVMAEDKEDIPYNELEFVIALAEQCFLNEYIYFLTEGEKIYLNTIISKCRDGEANEARISILACYFPLYKLLDHIPYLKSYKSSNQSLKQLFKLQILEPQEEIKLSKNIIKLGPIQDYISQKVKSQYEENPYPRWRYGNPLRNRNVSFVRAINDEINPNSISPSRDDRQLKVLVAGCGTGNQILHTQIFRNAMITAIDLSSSSLAYAQRKVNEMSIENVKLIQMDLLNVDLLETKFDIILCSGVLHHLDDPLKGLKALLGVLNRNGFLKLGLYSELARQDVIKARELIRKQDITISEQNIRNFRETIFSGKSQEINSLLSSLDFYSLSSCRDLCFHVKEHRFTIKQIQKNLIANNLRFLGFLLPQPIKSQYKDFFPKDKLQTNLQNWADYEEAYPNTFRGMYQFWVSRDE